MGRSKDVICENLPGGEPLESYQQKYEVKDNPVFAWMAYYVCHRDNLEVPAWVSDYLYRVALRISDTAGAARQGRQIDDIGKFSADALEMASPGAGNAINTYPQYDQVMEVAFAYISLKRRRNKKSKINRDHTNICSELAERFGVSISTIENRLRDWEKIRKDYG